MILTIMTNHTLNKIFAQSDCLTVQMMNDYLDGVLDGKAKHWVELHLESCELCRDELEGLSFMKDKMKLSDIIINLNHEISRRTHQRKKIALFPQVSAMAAIILLLVGFVWFFFYIVQISPESLRQDNYAQSMDKKMQDELKAYDEQSQLDLEKANQINDTLALVKPSEAEFESLGKSPSIKTTNQLDISLSEEELKVKTKDNIEYSVVREEIVDDKKEIADKNKGISLGDVSGKTDDKQDITISTEENAKSEELISRSKSKKKDETALTDNFKQGIEAFNNKEYKKALDLFTSNNEKNQQITGQNYYIAQCYQYLGNKRKAIYYYNKVIQSKEKEFLEPSLWNKSQVQLQMGQTKEAIETLNQTRDLNGSYALPAQNQIDSLRRK